MPHRLVRHLFTLFALSTAVAGPSACIDGDTESRVAYDTAAVRNADGQTLAGSSRPGGIYTVYQQPPGFPLTISTTALLETRTTSPGESSGDGGDGGSGEGWSHTEIRDGSVRILGDSTCSQESVECGETDCSVQLSVPGDGFCVVSVSLVGIAGETASDCWGYGWVDGRGDPPDERDRKHERLIERRDELCGG